ncbi:MAG TPA: serine/threonine-protein kinase [Gemmataceae bacterium]|nr:serine/threonine-protein kinase [Gemmataceae bacterium]
MRVRPPRISGYLLGPRLGGGPTCDVFSATGETSGEVWAIKVLREEAAADAANLQLFRREARVGMAVRHRHLVRVMAAEIDSDDPPHLVMERVPGRSLRWYLRRADWLTPRLAGDVGRQVAEALAALHAAGYLHADVKPDNLHLSPGGQAKLLDLGFAHRPGEDPGLLDDGFVLGTANYIAPEVCTGLAAEGPAADVFSLGVSLFELFTGCLPYPDGSVDETMTRHRDGAPDRLADWRGAWPAGAAALVDAMLARDPAGRPTAAEAAGELRRLFPRAADDVVLRVRR